MDNGRARLDEHSSDKRRGWDGVSTCVGLIKVPTYQSNGWSSAKKWVAAAIAPAWWWQCNDSRAEFSATAQSYEKTNCFSMSNLVGWAF